MRKRGRLVMGIEDALESIESKSGLAGCVGFQRSPALEEMLERIDAGRGMEALRAEVAPVEAFDPETIESPGQAEEAGAALCNRFDARGTDFEGGRVALWLSDDDGPAAVVDMTIAEAAGLVAELQRLIQRVRRSVERG